MLNRHFAIVLAISGAAFTMYACGSKKPPPPAAPEVDLDAGAADAEPPPPPPKKSLFDRLGGKDAIKAVVDNFVKKAAADKKATAFFKTTGKKMDTFKEAFINQICKDTGGDCTSTGNALVEAHKGAKTTDEQFDAVIADLKATLAELKVGDEEQGDLVALLEPMRAEIVTVKKKEPAPAKK